MRGSVTDGDTPSILERDLRGTFLNCGASEAPVSQASRNRQRSSERGAEALRSAPNYGEGTACRSGARADEGARMTRSPLMTATHARAMIGEMNRE
jgi:hypothetical protein